MTTTPKVFGIGLSKTGTLSLHRALEILGYGSVHLRHKEGPKAGRVVQPKDFADYDAGTDINVAAHYRNLGALYPDSKFIYTVRELESWLASIYWEFWTRPITDGQTPGLDGVIAGDQLLSDVAHEVYKFPRVWNSHFDRIGWQYQYVQHGDRIEGSFHGHRNLLVLNICGGDGWKKLCPFLDKPIPDVPFPHEHCGEYPWRANGHPPPEGLLV